MQSSTHGKARGQCRPRFEAIAFIALLLFSGAAADTLDIEVIIDTDNMMQERVVFTADAPTTFEYNAPYLSLDSFEGDCKVSGRAIVCDVVDSATIYLKGSASLLGYLETTEHGKKFSFGVEPPEGTQLRLTVKLPPHANVVVVNEMDQVYPVPSSTGTDLQSIVLHWEGTDRVFVEYRLPEQAGSVWLVLVVLGLGLLAGAGAVVLFRKQKKEEGVMRFLREDEMRVYTLVKQAGGSMLQGDIEKETGFSGPKLSKILRRLEEESILKRVPRGRKNIVKLAG